jgi:hypothetical protein
MCVQFLRTELYRFLRNVISVQYDTSEEAINLFVSKRIHKISHAKTTVITFITYTIKGKIQLKKIFRKNKNNLKTLLLVMLIGLLFKRSLVLIKNQTKYINIVSKKYFRRNKYGNKYDIF